MNINTRIQKDGTQKLAFFLVPHRIRILSSSKHVGFELQGAMAVGSPVVAGNFLLAPFQSSRDLGTIHISRNRILTLPSCPTDAF